MLIKSRFGETFYVEKLIKMLQDKPMFDFKELRGLESGMEALEAAIEFSNIYPEPTEKTVVNECWAAGYRECLNRLKHVLGVATIHVCDEGQVCEGDKTTINGESFECGKYGKPE